MHNLTGFPGSLGTQVLVNGKQSLITEGHLFMFYFFVAEIIYRLLMRRTGCLASTVVTWLGRQFLYLENTRW